MADMEIKLLRPEWLILVIPVLILFYQFLKNMRLNRNWAAVIDARLLPHLLSGKTGQRRLWPIFVWLILSLLVLIILAAPVWEKLPLPVFSKQSALVVALDLSRSMNAQDVKPSRLARARLKLKDLLNMRSEGQTALIAYAATAYTVSPLTDDTDTIASLLSSLETNIMPAQGSRADLAVEKALQLFNNAGISRGEVLIITDGVDDRVQSSIDALDLRGFNVSILSVGSEQGAPIPTGSGGFVKDDAGSIVIVKTDEPALQSLATRHSGVYTALTINDDDLHRLQHKFDADSVNSAHQETDFKTDRWREQAPWLLLVITPLAALLFRRGVILSALLVFLLLPQAGPVQAADGFDWQVLWKNKNQRAAQALQNGQAGQAAQMFESAEWKAVAHYRAGEYEQALQQLQGQASLDSLYNRGNALAKMGRFEEALESYDQVLQQDKGYEDAAYNRRLVEEALKQQQNQQQQQGADQEQQQNNQTQQDNQQSQQSQNQQGESDQQDSEDPQQQEGQNDNRQDPSQQSQNDQQPMPQPEKADEPQDTAQQADQSETEQQDANQDQQPGESAELSDQQQQNELSEQAEAQWLRRIPDDPGGLLRNKFRYQYSRQQAPTKEKQPW